MSNQDRLQPVIGLEVHCQLATETKLFSRAPTVSGSPPNTRVAPVEAGLPGALPVVNRRAVREAVRVGAALDAQIQPRSRFARKHYFYADLPKGYQITQFRNPLARGGEISVDAGDGVEVQVGLERLHLEEDTGKSVRVDDGDAVLVDLNRAGVPLVEIVTRPEIHSPDRASACLREIRDLVVSLGVSDGEMSEGSLRCDANVSLRDRLEGECRERVELKNINSFKFVRDGLRREIDRQIDAVRNGAEIERQTRAYDPDRRRTIRLRGKEDDRDYRYLPDPDLPVLEVDPETVETIRCELPDVPARRRGRYRDEWGLEADRAALFASDRGLAEWFEALVAAVDCDPPTAGSWMANAVLAALNRHDRERGRPPIEPRRAARVLEMTESGRIDETAGDEILDVLIESGGEPEEIVEERELAQVRDEDRVAAWVEDVLEAHPEQVRAYREGKSELLGWFIGQVMQSSDGRADAQVVRRQLRERLEEG